MHLSSLALGLLSAAILVLSIDGGRSHKSKRQGEEHQQRQAAADPKPPKQTWDQVWQGCPQIFWDTFFIPNNQYHWGATNRIRVRMTSYEKDVVSGRY